MSVAYNFLLSSRGQQKIPHLLVLNLNQRTGRFDGWSYYQIQGKIKMMPPKATGNEVRFGMSQAQFDLYTSGSMYGTLTLQKSLNTLIVGDKGEFQSFTGNTDDASFTGKT